MGVYVCATYAYVITKTHGALSTCKSDQKFKLKFKFWQILLPIEDDDDDHHDEGNDDDVCACMHMWRYVCVCAVVVDAVRLFV